MLFSSPVIAALLALAPTLVQQTVAQTHKFCTTNYGSSSVASIPTSSVVFTKTRRGKVTAHLTPVIGTTPSPVTITILSTLLNTAIETYGSVDTITSTLTFSANATTYLPTQTLTTVLTTAVTSTSLGPTLTVPTVDGFSAIQTSVPLGTLADAASGVDDTLTGTLSGLIPRGKLFSRAKAAVLPAINLLALSGPGALANHFLSRPAAKSKLFPQGVGCVAIVTTHHRRTVTRTALPTTISALAPTSTISAMVTVTVTSTSTLDGVIAVVTSLTETSTLTVAPTSTSTLSMTNTYIVDGPTSTFYAACDQSNMIDTIAGQVITNAADSSDGSSVGQYATNVTSPYECCEYCAQDTNCAIWALLPYADNGCYSLQSPDTSPMCGDDIDIYASGTDRTYGMILGNGCAQAVPYSAS